MCAFNQSTAENKIQNSSNLAIEGAFASLKKYFGYSRWLGTTNRYSKKTIERINSHDMRNSSHNKHAKEYIAASAILHCIDGWSFLGRVSDCIIKGDCDTARHLGYYSELRAAMSLLAIEGIGVFRYKHLVVDSSATLKIQDIGTHSFAWFALNHWADSVPRSSDLLMDIIRPDGIPIKTWLSYFTFNHAPRPQVSFIGNDWLKAWGLDLRRLCGDDYDARNESSYRPNNFENKNNLDAKSSTNFLCNLWNSFEPSSQARFENIDRFLLKKCLEKVSNSIQVSKKRDDFKKRIINMTEQLFLDDSKKEMWQKFLLDPSNLQMPMIITEAFKKNGPNNHRHHLQVASRAALLLRVATSACARLLRQNGIMRDNLKFWWKTFGENRGLWDNSPDDFLDLWADIEVAIEDTCEWNENTNESDCSYYKLRNDLSNALSKLVGCELIALWGLGL